MPFIDSPELSFKNMPSNTQALWGGGGFPNGGNISARGDVSRKPLLAANGVSPYTTGADAVIAVFTIPANTFDAEGRGARIEAAGNFGANGNNKTLKIIVGATTPAVGATVSGGTTIASTGVSAQNGGGWFIEAEMLKIGAKGSNTQLSFQTSSAVVPVGPQELTQTESAAITVCITANAATTASDIVMLMSKIIGIN